MIAADPNRSRTSSSVASRRRRERTIERQRELDGAVVVEVAEGQPDQRDALALGSSAWPRRAALARWRGSSRCARSPPGACASASRARSRRTAAGARPCGTRGAPPAAGARGGRRARRGRCRGSRATWACARARAASRSSGAGDPTWTGRGSRLWARAWRWRPAARPSIRTSVASPSCATCPTVVMEPSRSLAAVTGPTPHSRSTGSGCRNSSSPSVGTTSRPSGLATPLATLARNFVLATPTETGQADLLEDVPAQPHGDLRRRARDPPQPADVEERLVDRQPLHERRRVVEDLEHRLARVAVGLHPRAGRRSPAGTAGEPGLRPSACGRRTPWPRSWPRARRRPRR